MNDEQIIPSINFDGIMDSIKNLAPDTIVFRQDMGGALMLNDEPICVSADYNPYSSTIGKEIIWGVRQIDNEIHFFSNIPTYNKETLLWEGNQILVPFADKNELLTVDCDKPFRIFCQLFVE